MKMTTFFRRLALMLLVLLAIFSTIGFISNITFNDLMEWFEKDRHQIDVGYGFHYAEDREIPLQEKKMSVLKPKKYITHENIQPQTIEELIDPVQYPSVEVIATGYTAGIESTGKTRNHPEYGITYSGVEVKRDLYSTIAADLNIYPIGTIMYIDRKSVV